MAVKIRLQRQGRRNAPSYRIVVAESKFSRDGRSVEQIGFYNPQARGQEIEVKIDLDRIEYWMKVGAQPTDTVQSLLRRYKRANAVA